MPSLAVRAVAVEPVPLILAPCHPSIPVTPERAEISVWVPAVAENELATLAVPRPLKFCVYTLGPWEVMEIVTAD